MKYLITGGSGFIGTNLIDQLSKNPAVEIVNIDIVEPKIKDHDKFWRKADIRDKEALNKALADYDPDYVVHLAARTDLDGKELSDYEANMSGVSNLLEVLSAKSSIKRAVFASSMYVCEPGYMPVDFEDYAPHTLYGESKVKTEKIIKSYNPGTYTWSIIRPTSIWGPWFGTPYDKFFNIVLNHMYFHMGKRACRKTYGYVDNAVYQIMSILNAPVDDVSTKVFYLGDYKPYDITDWANEIAAEAGIKIPNIPYFLFVLAGWFGDALKLVGIKFPMTSFRLHNMTTDNVHDLTPIQKIAPETPVDRLTGTKRTIDWIKTKKQIAKA